MNPDDCPNRLDWLAFCYAAGELSPDEAQQFESRLADDQAAREALAQAVELAQSTAAAEAQSQFVVPAARPRMTWADRLSWMAVGVAAAILLALSWSALVSPSGHRSQPTLAAASQQTLAFAWSETRDELARVREAGLWPTLYDQPESEAADEVDAIGGYDADLDETPAWLVVAVAGRLSLDPELQTNEGLEN